MEFDMAGDKTFCV